MNWNGIVVGAITFFTIALFHPIVVKCEYYFSAKIWPFFLSLGVVLSVCSLLVENENLSAILAVIGFSSLWSVIELKHQAKRVEKGWFPRNPKRNLK